MSTRSARPSSHSASPPEPQLQPPLLEVLDAAGVLFVLLAGFGPLVWRILV